MKMMKTILALTLIVGLSACGEWNQDPLADIAGAFPKGTEKPTPDQSPKPINSEAIRIDSPDSFAFQEGVAGEFDITSRVLEPGYVGTLTITNLADLAGAVYDAKSGKLRWTPAVGTVLGTDGLEAKRSLGVLVLAKKADAISLTRTKSISLTIRREASTPEIKSMTLNLTSMREGEILNGKVIYNDNEIDPKDSSTWPKLQFSSGSTSPNLTNFINIGYTRYDSFYKAIISDISIDLTKAEVTKNSSEAQLVVRAFSRFNKVSPDMSRSIRIYTSMADAVATWTQALVVTAGQAASYDFLLMDPKSELLLTAEFSTPVSSLISCSAVNPSVLSCRLNWNVPVTAALGAATLSGTVQKRNTYTGDTSVISQPISLPYEVIAPPTTTTTTTTTTSTVSTTSTTVLPGVQ